MGREAWDVWGFSLFLLPFFLPFLPFFFFFLSCGKKVGVLWEYPNLVFSLFSEEALWPLALVIQLLQTKPPAGLMNCNNSETSLQELILEFKTPSRSGGFKIWAQHKPLHFQVHLLPWQDATSCLLKGKKKKLLKGSFKKGWGAFWDLRSFPLKNIFWWYKCKQIKKHMDWISTIQDFLNDGRVEVCLEKYVFGFTDSEQANELWSFWQTLRQVCPSSVFEGL